jgi:hypothetical protein
MKLFRLTAALIVLAGAHTAQAQPTLPPQPPVSPNDPGPPGTWSPNPDIPASGYTDFVKSAYWSSCEALKEACAGEKPEDLLLVALYGSLPVGLCRAEDIPPLGTEPSSTFLVEQIWRPGDHALPWGLGVVRYSPDTVAEGRRRAGEILKSLCVKGKCCCPILPGIECAEEIPVVAWDPVTATCCTFPNKCSLPEGWEFRPYPGQTEDYRCY